MFKIVSLKIETCTSIFLLGKSFSQFTKSKVFYARYIGFFVIPYKPLVWWWIKDLMMGFGV